MHSIPFHSAVTQVAALRDGHVAVPPPRCQRLRCIEAAPARGSHAFAHCAALAIGFQDHQAAKIAT